MRASRALICGAVLAASVGCAVSSEPDSLLITNATIVSPERAEPRAHASVYIVGDRIVAVGNRATGRRAEQVIDAGGAYLAPGLIDSHVHLYNTTGLRRQYTEKFEALRDAYYAQAAMSYLYFGFTSVIELNNVPSATERFLAAEFAPTVSHCSEYLVLTDGYMVFESGGDVAEWKNVVYDRYRGNPLPEGFDPAEHTPEKIVAQIAADGAVCVKALYEDGFGGSVEREWELPTLEITRDVAKAAKARGLPLVLHANSYDAQRFALDAGVDAVGHGLWHWGEDADAAEITPRVAALLDEIAAAKVGIQPTIRVLQSAAAMFDDDFLNDERLADALPAVYLDWLKSEEGQARRDVFRKMFGEGKDDDAIRSAQAAFIDKARSTVGYLDRAGANLLFGADTAVGMGWGNPPGLNGRLEMDEWIAGGARPRAVFEAATLHNAAMFGMSDDAGSIEAGKRADLLLMTGNPLESVAAYDTITTVILRGRPIDRAALSARRSQRASP